MKELTLLIFQAVNELEESRAKDLSTSIVVGLNDDEVRST
jgi:hypothetical protein